MIRLDQAPRPALDPRPSTLDSSANILPFPPGQNMPALTGEVISPVEVSPPPIKEMLAEVYARLTDAALTGRATLDPAQTALCVEIANAAWRRGIEDGAGPMHLGPAPFFHR